MPFPTLTPLEADVLALLLAGDVPGMAELRTQLAAARVASRQHSGVGFFTHFEVPAGVPAPVLPKQVVLSDVYAELRGVEHEVGFLLFFEVGRLSALEGFMYGGSPWPTPEEVLGLGHLTETATGPGSCSLTPTATRDLVALQRRLAGEA